MSAAERRPHLIRAAIEVMKRDGVAGATTRAIAAETGIAQAMVHYLYGAKDELYKAVIEQLTADVRERSRRRLGAMAPDSDFRTAVETFAADLWASVNEDPGIHRLLTELYVVGLRWDSLRDAIADYQRDLDAAVEAVFQSAAERTGTTTARPIHEVARFFFAGFDGLVLHRLARPDDEADQRSIEALVEATVALAEGRPPFAGNHRAAIASAQSNDVLPPARRLLGEPLSR
jgi:AcrR family transcriptional regulator